MKPSPSGKREPAPASVRRTRAGPVDGRVVVGHDADAERHLADRLAADRGERAEVGELQEQQERQQRQRRQRRASPPVASAAIRSVK